MLKLFLLSIEVYHPSHLSPVLQSYLIFPFLLTGRILFLALEEGKGISLSFTLSFQTNYTYVYTYQFQNLNFTTGLIHILSDASISRINVTTLLNREIQDNKCAYNVFGNIDVAGPPPLPPIVPIARKGSYNGEKILT
jgi:hypothetical protein